YQFGIKKGSEPIKDWADLKGKSVSVNKGTPYETLSKAKGAEHGFTVQVYDTQPDATQAVLSGRAYATLGGNTTIVYAASKNSQFVADLELKETRAHWAAPVPKNNPKLRAQAPAKPGLGSLRKPPWRLARAPAEPWRGSKAVRSWTRGGSTSTSAPCTCSRASI